MGVPQKPDFGKLCELREKLEEEERNYRDFMALPEPERLAVYIHDRKCSQNHTDGCGWFYENDWTGYTKKRYLEAAKRALEKGLTYDQVVAVFDAFQGV